MRGIQWDSSNKWEFELQGLNDLFGGWLPATSVELNFFGLTSEGIGSSGTDYLSGHTYPTLQLSYIEPEDLRITNYLTNWMDDCVSHDGYEVKTIAQASKTFKVVKTLSTNATQYVWTGKVIPQGAMVFTGDTDGSVTQYQITFLVVGGSLKWETI